jgi:ABC-type Zn uptake system ZnuABC Zn-binding protein ZnuA
VVDPTKLAAVFDAMADYVDQVESEKTSSVEAARQARIDKIAAAHAAAHGEELPEATRKKLASNDAALDYVEDLLTKQAGVVTPLGAGASPDSDPQPRTVKEAADAADERFLNFLISS